MSGRLTLKEITRFFIPLIFMAELMMVSHSIIHGFLARLDAPKTTLAAFSIAFSIHVLLAGFVIVLVMVSINFSTNKKNVRRMLVFSLFITLPSTVLLLVLATTPLGLLIFQGVLGASAGVSQMAQEASFLFAFLMPIIGVRQIFNGLIMRARRTLWITLATGIRVVSLVVFLFLTPAILKGAAAGALALVLCIGVETLLVLIISRPFYQLLPPDEEADLTFFQVWKFAWPLMVNQMAENSLAILINIFLGRLTQPDLALASFGVVRGLVMLLVSPLRNLAQTAQSLVKTGADAKVMMTFAFRVMWIFSGMFALLFFTPLRFVILDTIMGLPPALSAYAQPALMAAMGVPIIWGFASVLRGMVTLTGTTSSLAFSAGGRVMMVVGVGSITLLVPGLNGAVVGIVALIGAISAEGLILGWWLYGGEGLTKRLPEEKS